MTLQSAIEAELPFLRREAIARMTARVTVRRKTGEMDPQNDDNGLEVPEWATIHDDLPFRLDGSGTGDGGSRTVTVGGVEYQQATGVGHFPAATEDLADNDYIEVVEGEWAGSVYRVVEATKKDQATARRVPIVTEDRPEEWA